MKPDQVWTTSITLDVETRGHGIPDGQRQLVERLRRQAFAVQKHFQLAENSALILDESLGDDESSVASAIDHSYEAHAFWTLRTQLFRLLVVDLSAAVLDKDPRTGSVQAILKELRRESEMLDALRSYYADTSCLHVTVEGKGLDPETLKRLKRQAIQRSSEESMQAMDAQWARIDKGSGILNTDSAKRILWARHKTTAHIERTETGVVALDDDPPHGEGKMTWDEPIRFLSEVRPYVYDVYALVTANHWGDDHTVISRFYAKAFWDRFKNGGTDLEP